jgi:hypothetical protein
MEIWYTCRYKFDTSNVGWDSYYQWANIPQLVEILSLDIHLCRDVIENLTPEDWEHNIQEDFLITYFHDLPYLMERTREVRETTHLFAVCLEPETDARAAWSGSSFEFVGYDLLDDEATFSILTDWSGFEKALDTSILSSSGLITDYVLAESVMEKLQEFYPNVEHLNGNIWAISKYIGVDAGRAK